jgi:hypothetical protein
MSAERPDEVDEEFNRIVSGLGPGWGSALPAWPDPQDATDSDDTDDTDEPDKPAVGSPSAQPAAAAGAPATAAPSADDEHFSPPPPPPLPRPEPVTVLCWFLVLGAPIVMVVLTLAGWYVPRWVLGLIGIGFVAGVITLVLRLDNHPRDTDSGAVV